VFVTHDQDEALEVADRIAVMNNGKIEQVGGPDEVYHHPTSPFVYNFLGNVNLFHGRAEDDKLSFHEQPTGEVMYARPHLLEIRRQANGGSHFRATIKHINSAGPLVKIEALAEWGRPVHVEMSQEKFRDLGLVPNESVFVIPKEVKAFQNKAVS
jgi:sulfate transport system ATP-binding protein